MRLAIVGLTESFHSMLADEIDELDMHIVSVLGGTGCEEGAAELAAQHGAQARTEIQEVIKDRPDCAMVGDWYFDRPTRIIPLLEAGVPVLSTKVLGADYPQTLKAIEAARRTNTVLMSGSVYRHAPSVVGTREKIAAGDWGRPVYARMIMPHGMDRRNDRRDCGGMLTYFGLHPLSATIPLLGGNVKRVSAMGGVYSDQGFEIEDAVVITVQLDNDAIAVAEVLACQAPHYSATTVELDVHCTKESARIPFVEGLAHGWYGRPIVETNIHHVINGYSRWLRIFVDAIERGESPVDFQEYIEVAAALHMARISRDEGRTVNRNELQEDC